MNKKLIFILILAGLSLGTFGLYLFYAGNLFRIGFPLDDAWIHQTFARNLFEYQEWSFNPGQPTSGSTSPLWTLLLTVAFLFRINPLYWTYYVGFLLLLLTCSFMVVSIYRADPTNKILLGALVLIICGMEWHLIWSAASGMETILFALLVTLIYYLVIHNPDKIVLLGILTGLAVWTRPEGITLAGPIFFVMIMESWGDKKEFTRRILCYLGTAFLFILPYLYFNLLLSGSLWPNTLLAKQTEYRNYLEMNIFLRYLKLFTAPLVGSNILLLPGFIYGLINIRKARNYRTAALYLWLFGFVFIYATQLPVTYQHARYLIPLIPVYICLSLPGVIEIFIRIKTYRIGRIIGQVWIISTMLVCIGFAYLGAKAYSLDVAIIETEMVEPSKWIYTNTPPDSVIAAHDIGALGYFGQRTVIDLAGLINKEVIPIINDPKQILEFIKASDADYLMIFPGWYGKPLVPFSDSVYAGQYNFAKESGGEIMQIYIINKSQ